MAQHCQSVDSGAARVHDQRQLSGKGGLDVDGEALTLPRHVGHAAPTQTVVVQPGFANRHHARQCGSRHQVGQLGFAYAFVVGVHAHRAPEVLVYPGQLVHRLELFQRGADAQGAVHLSSRHFAADVGQARAQLGKAQVAVGVNKHDVRKFAPMSCTADAGPSMGKPWWLRASALAWPTRYWCPESPRS